MRMQKCHLFCVNTHQHVQSGRQKNLYNPSEPWLSVSKRVDAQLRNTQLTKTHFYLPYGRINSYTSIYIYIEVDSYYKLTRKDERICHTWSRGRRFSPSLPGDRYLNIGSKSDHRAEISGNIARYDALAPR